MVGTRPCFVHPADQLLALSAKGQQTDKVRIEQKQDVWVGIEQLMAHGTRNSVNVVLSHNLSELHSQTQEQMKKKE